MMASFAAYVLLLSLLISLAALAAEPLLSGWGVPRRLVWAVALCASIAGPTAMSLSASPSVPGEAATASVLSMLPVTPSPAIIPDRHAVPAASAATVTQPPDAHAATLPRAHRITSASMETLVRVVWPASCVAVWLFHALGIGRLLLTTRRCPRIAVLGTPARLTNGVGPAVFGIWRPIILWPRWLQTAPSTLRHAALAHELEHLRCRDPMLLGAATLLVSLAPWNALLWWQLQRLRFAVEADCDGRVVGGGRDRGRGRVAAAPRYAEVLWQIGRRRVHAGYGPALWMSAHTWLERRIRLLLAVPRQRRAWLGAAGMSATAMLLVGAALVRAPSLAATELHKLPPQDARPAAAWAITAARGHFPKLLLQPFAGTALIAAVFDRQGRLELVAQHRFAAGTPPSDFDMGAENRQLGIDPDQDLFYAGNEGTEGIGQGLTIGPWLASPNRGRIFVVYEVLKWKPDPTRSAARVLAALKAGAPILFVQPAFPGVPPPTTFVAVFMNNDGTINRLQKKTTPAGQSFTMEWPPLYAAMGLTPRELGRTGFLAQPQPNTFVSYAWPRRADDPTGEDGLGPSLGPIVKNHTPGYDDTADDASLAKRYFPEIAQRGWKAVTQRIDDVRTRALPWILFGRDGRVWGTGLWHNDTKKLVFSVATYAAIEARYPGIRVQGDSVDPWSVRGVPIMAFWVRADSPIQSEAQVPWTKRKDLLVSGAFMVRRLYPDWAPSPTLADAPVPFAAAVNLGDAVDVGPFGYRGADAEAPFFLIVTANPRGADEVSLKVQFDVCGMGQMAASATPACLRSAVLRAHYDAPVEVPLQNDPQAQAMYSHIVLRVQRLRT